MVSRRWFIAAAAATAGVGRAQLLQAATSDTLDTAIVGGGVSGLYSAFRLVEAGMPANQLAVFEATDRIGGRTFSVRMPGAEGIVSEFGGMRYLTSHRIATALIEHLAIPNRGFPMGGGRTTWSTSGANAGRWATMRARARSRSTSRQTSRDWIPSR